MGEQKKTEEEKLKVVAEQQETEKQRQIALTNYAMSRKQAFDIIKLIETSEPKFASIPALHDRRKELLDTASEACRQFLKQDPEDHKLRQQAAQIFRFRANFYRLINETREAERAYNEGVSLPEKLVETSPEEAREDNLALAHTLRDYANMQILQGRLKEAAESVSRSFEIAKGLLKLDPKNPNYVRSQALAYLAQARIEYREAKLGLMDKPRETIDCSIELLQQIAEGPVVNHLAYDPLLLASSWNMKALIEREGGNLFNAKEAHKKAVAFLTGPLDINSNKLNEADVTEFLSLCIVEQSKTLALLSPSNFDTAQKNITLAIEQLRPLDIKYVNIPTYKEVAGYALLIRGEIWEQAEEFQKAAKDYKDSIALLHPLATKHFDLAELHGDLGNAYSGLSRVNGPLGKEKDDALKNAKGQLEQAKLQSPTDIRFARWLSDLRK